MTLLATVGLTNPEIKPDSRGSSPGMTLKGRCRRSFFRTVGIIPVLIDVDSRQSRHPRARPGDRSWHRTGLGPRDEPGDDVERAVP